MPWEDQILFQKQKDKHSLMHKVFPELLPCTRPASDSEDKADLALLLFCRGVGQKQASRQKINAYLPSKENEPTT